jgi:drug/metabolite transporter (DMT)-like permease
MTVAPTAYLAGIIMIVSSTIFLSLAGVIVRVLSVDEWTIVFWRSAFMSLTMLIVLAVFKRGRVKSAFREAGRAGLYSGIAIGLAIICYIFSISRTTVANTLVLVAAAPLFAALLGMVILKERVTPRTWTAIAIACGGIALMFLERMGAGELFGNLLAIIAALLYAFSIVVMRGSGEVNLIPAIFIAGLVSAAITLPYAEFSDIPVRQMAILAAMGVGQMGLGLVLFVFGAQRLPPAETALLALIETILAPLWVWLAINEVPSNWALIGGGILFATVLANTALSLRRRPRFG